MSFPKPIDLTTSSRRSRKRSIDDSNSSTNSILFPSSTTPPSVTSSNNAGPNSDNFHTGGQPIFDLHSALNNINKTFTIGSSKPAHTRTRSLSSALMGISEGTSPSPPPCPVPNLPLWGPLANIHPILGAPSPLMTPHLINFSKSLGVSVPIKSSAPAPLALSSSYSFSRSTLTSSASSTPPTIGHPFTSMTDNQVSKYNQLLLVLDEMSKDVRPSYAGNKSSVERLRRSIAHARYLVQEALIESEKNSRN